MKTWQEYKEELKAYIKIWGLECQLMNDIDSSLITIADRDGSVQVYFNPEAIPTAEEEE
jgi:hypothetical protein